MLPNAFVEMATWPLSYNGKIDRNALPEPRRDSIASPGFVAARNSTEATIAAIWTELLGTANIGIYDNFFEAGGHSLLATIAISRMQNAFGVKIPLAPVFQEPTIANCANIISLAMKTTPVLASVTLPASDDEEEVTL
jgi:acyl carrier protein